ncbi:MAG: hypothetical protein H9789_11985, partial [Candidatus Paraprevotella stercoravium]|nr:hypothetical protein [Candidatus Paraprevotella stercoravium]
FFRSFAKDRIHHVPIHHACHILAFICEAHHGSIVVYTSFYQIFAYVLYAAEIWRVVFGNV